MTAPDTADLVFEPAEPLPVIEVRCDTTPQDALAVYWHAYRKKLRWATFWNVLSGLIIIAAGVSHLPQDPAFSRMILLVSGGSLVILGLARTHLWKGQIQQVMKQTPDAGEERFTFSPDGFGAESAVSSGFLRWTAFTHFVVIERPERRLVLYRGPHVPIIVPHRFFRSEDQWQQTLALVNEYIGRDALPRGRGFEVEPTPGGDSTQRASQSA